MEMYVEMHGNSRDTKCCICTVIKSPSLLYLNQLGMMPKQCAHSLKTSDHLFPKRAMSKCMIKGRNDVMSMTSQINRFLAKMILKVDREIKSCDQTAVEKYMGLVPFESSVLTIVLMLVAIVTSHLAAVL